MRKKKKVASSNRAGKGAKCRFRSFGSVELQDSLYREE